MATRSVCRFGPLLFGVALSGCGESAAKTGPDADDCAIDVVLSGRIEDHVSGPQNCGPSGVYASPAAIAASFMSGPHGDFGIKLFDVTKGQLGKVRASLSIIQQPNARGWSTPDASCEIDITEWRLVDDQFQNFSEYRYLGSGTCSSPALPFGGTTGEVTFAPFTLQAWLLWEH